MCRIWKRWNLHTNIFNLTTSLRTAFQSIQFISCRWKKCFTKRISTYAKLSFWYKIKKTCVFLFITMILSKIIYFFTGFINYRADGIPYCCPLYFLKNNTCQGRLHILRNTRHQKIIIIVNSLIKYKVKRSILVWI